MKNTFKKSVVFKKIRWQGNCPECKRSLILDDEVFSRDTKIIACYSCQSNYLVISLDRKRDITVDLIKDSSKKENKDEQAG